MATEKKVETVKALQDMLSKSSIAIVADFRGIAAGELMPLRRKMREQGVEFKVVKNTLVDLAARNAGRPGAEVLLSGPSAIAFAEGDAAAAAKALTEYIKTTKSTLKVKGALMSEGPLSAEQVSVLASLPPKNVLVGQMLGRLKSPLVSLVFTLSATMTGLVVVLQGRVKQMEANP